MKKGMLFLMFALFSVMIACDRSGIKLQKTEQALLQYDTFYIRFNLNHKFENPFDPADIQVDALIIVPDNQDLVLPCFYRSGKSGGSEWEARFTPVQPGEHRFRIRTISGGDTSVSGKRSFSVQPSDHDGFLRLNNQSYYTMQFDSRKRFRGVGLNLCWENASKWPYPYETYFQAAEENEINFVRIWMCPWNLPLEWTTVNHYQSITDEFENWDMTFARSSGLKLESGLTDYTEDDKNRIHIPEKSKEEIIYKFDNIRRFKIKMFYNKELSKDKISCWGSKDNKRYEPIDTEFSESWDTKDGWHRIFLARIAELPDGINYCKIILGNQIKGDIRLAGAWIEHGTPQDVTAAPGLGRYYQKTAERFDQILNLARDHGVYLMLVHDYHGQFKDYVDKWASNADWRSHPYNSANGGPCDTPADFFTHPEAKRYYKNRLRYMVARWSFSTNLAVWEFWNEIDNAMEWQNIPPETIVSWHQEMADYLRKIDPHKHIISTSVVYREVPGLWDIENLDFSQHHNYGTTDNMYESIMKYENAFHKPDVVGEFAISWKPPGQDKPAEAYEYEMHNGLWRGLFSPTPILPLSWWWEYHYENGHYFHFEKAGAFLKKIMENKSAPLKEMAVRGEDEDVDVMALQSGDELYIWMLNTKEQPAYLMEFNLAGKEGSYDAQWFNPWNGEYQETLPVQIDNGVLRFTQISLFPNKDRVLCLKRMK